jgi:signal transduction histidine kinase
VDLNFVLRGTLEMMCGRIANADLKVDEQLAPALPPIMADPMLIEQVFVSLIDNAIDAMPGGSGTITLITGTEPDNGAGLRVFAEVRDTGVGIRKEEIPKILKSFYTTKAQGTGLGLAIAKKFTEAYSGALSVWSRPGEGTIFRVTFPAQQEV